MAPLPAPERGALLIPTHVWSRKIAAGMQPFIDSALRCGLEVHILYCPNHDEGFLAETAWEADRTLRRAPTSRWGVVNVHRVPASAVRRQYTVGFDCAWDSAWFSNHWNLMYFWRRVARRVRLTHVWSLEYDVRAVGDIDALWGLGSRADLVTTTKTHEIPAGSPQGGLSPAVLSRLGRDTSLSAFKQVFRVSTRFLAHADRRFRAGINGQDERILPTLAATGGFKLAALPSSVLASGWTCDGEAAPANERAWRRARIDAARTLRSTDMTPRRRRHWGGSPLKLWHPVK